MKRLLPILIILPLTLIIHPLNAQICYDWKSQSTAYVINGTSPEDPSFYQWEEIANIKQGIHLCVLNADVIPVYIQQGNNYINFTSRFGPSTALMFMLRLEVNIDDQGYSDLHYGSAMQDIVWYGSSEAFPDIGNYKLQVRITFFDGTIRLREYNIKVIPSSDKLYKDNAGNTLRKWTGNDPNGLNAIVFSEGFDAYNTNGQEMYYHAASALVECFNENGYDVFLLDNYFGTQTIRSNAAVFASAVEFISNLYGQELIVAGGVSMGGIISRYALAKAEEQGDPLPVHTFIAIDSPHQGAVVSEPLQNFKKDNEEDDEFAKHALSNDAALQMLLYNAYDPDGNVHTSFYEEFNSLNGDGYPHFTKNIGVSFSTPEPNPNSGGWYKITYHTGPFSGTVKTFDLTEAEMMAGSWLPKDLTTMSPIIKRASYWWIQLLVPIAQPLFYPTIEFERFTDPAYIPYYSALDIRDGKSMFDVCIEPDQTTYHDVLPEEILEEVLNEVIYTNTYFQNTNVIGYWELKGDKVASGHYVTPLIAKGDVIVHPGGRLDIAARKVAILRDGFSSRYGSECNIKTDPTFYDECLGTMPENSARLEEDIIVNKKLADRLQASLFPNPASDKVQLRLPDAMTEAVTASIYNMCSEVVYYHRFPAGKNAILDIRNLKSGTYVVEVTSGQKSATCKLIKL